MGALIRNPFGKWQFSKRLQSILLRIIWGCGTIALLSVFIFITTQIFKPESLQFHSILPADLVLAGLEAYGASPATYTWFHDLRILLFAVISIITGIMIYLRKPSEWITVYFSLVLVAMGVLISLELQSPPADLPPIYSLLINSAFTAFFFSFYIFPDGRFVPGWTRWLIPGWVVTIVSVSLFSGTGLDLNSWPPLISVPIYLVLLGSSPAAQVYRFRKASNTDQRQQIKLVVYGLTIFVTSFLGFWIPLMFASELQISGLTAVIYDLFGGTLLIIAFAVVPLSIGAALLRYRLWDIDPIINRTLVYIVLTAMTIAIYVLLVGLLSTIFQMRSHPVFAFLATGVVAVIFQPLRQRLQRVVNQFMYGERDNPYTVIARLGQRLGATLTPDAVLPTIVETVKDALKLPYCAIALQQDSGMEVVASDGVLSGMPVRLPLVYQNQAIGELVLATRSPGEDFNPADRRLLEDLAGQAGIAAHSVGLITELQHARERLVITREEERRRLRRDLHDGLGPHLASQTLTITAARQLLRQDPEAADQLLAEVVKHAQSAIDDIRRLVYDLRPPALDDLGLIGALNARAKEFEQSGLQITIHVPEKLPPLPAAVETACYRIALEALTNVVHHAMARHCTVSMNLKGKLCLEIIDDGCGLPVEYRAGVGLNSMRERAEELGGSFMIEPALHCGTRVVVELPLAGDS